MLKPLSIMMSILIAGGLSAAYLNSPSWVIVLLMIFAALTMAFIVALNSSTPAQNKAFQDYVEAKKLGWWHWLNNFWLVYTHRDDVSASQLRDELDRLYPRTRKIVLSLRSDGTETWAGFGPSAQDHDMFKMDTTKLAEEKVELVRPSSKKRHWFRVHS